MKKQINIAVIGMGYVGLPLAIEFGKKYHTVGFDIDKKKISSLCKFEDPNGEISIKEIKKSNKLAFSFSREDLIKCNFYIICVPTPINKKNQPDLSKLKNATILISDVISNLDFVVFESTVYPGVTENYCIKIIEKKTKLKAIYNDKNKNGFYCGYSPERLNPGEKDRKIYEITKIVSGTSKYATKIINKVYGSVLNNNIFQASSIKVAESAKIIENVQRDVNIALINEFTKILNKDLIDVYEVLSAASTKWNFHNYYPGLVGGHCIGVDPYYLSYYSKQRGVDPKIILAGRTINDSMYKHVIRKLNYYAQINKIKINESKILIMGYTFKENCADIRNTQVKKIYNYYKNKAKKIHIYDPLVNNHLVEKKLLSYFVRELKINYYDIILITVGHDHFKKIGKDKLKSFAKKKSIIFDIKNIYRNDSFYNL